VIEQVYSEKEKHRDKDVEAQWIQLALPPAGIEVRRKFAGLCEEPCHAREELPFEVKEVLQQIVRQMVKRPVIIDIMLSAVCAIGSAQWRLTIQAEARW
jgi:hypothetical protein